MCTLTAIPLEEGLIVTMNRDERKSRQESGTLARVEDAAGRLRAVYPVDESSGGTWFAVHTRGLALALLNRYPQADGGTYSESRGTLIPRLLELHDLTAMTTALRDLTLDNFAPFDLYILSEREYRHLSWQGGERHWQQTVYLPALFATSSSVDPLPTQARRRESFMLGMRALRRGSGGRDAILRSIHLQQDPDDTSRSILVARAHTHTKSICQANLCPERLDLRYYDESGLQALRAAAEGVAPAARVDLAAAAL